MKEKVKFGIKREITHSIVKGKVQFELQSENKIWNSKEKYNLKWNGTFKNEMKRDINIRILSEKHSSELKEMSRFRIKGTISILD